MSDVFKQELVALIPKLRGHAMALTGSSAEADDLVQEALVRAWRFRASFREDSNLSAWANKILRNTFYTIANSRKNTVQDVDGQYAAQLTCDADQEWRMRYADLMRAMQQLGVEARDALLLVVVEGLSYQEAAEIAGCPVGTMKSRVNRARERLSELVEVDLPKAAARARRREIEPAPATWPPQLSRSDRKLNLTANAA